MGQGSHGKVQRQATRPVDEGFLEGVVRPRLLGTQQAVLRSQSGPFLPLLQFSFCSSRAARNRAPVASLVVAGCVFFWIQNVFSGDKKLLLTFPEVKGVSPIV